jgi:hypothetical protein
MATEVVIAAVGIAAGALAARAYKQWSDRRRAMKDMLARFTGRDRLTHLTIDDMRACPRCGTWLPPDAPAACDDTACPFDGR